MDEQDWLACTDPAKMLEFLRAKASDRKFRLFACACCRRIWPFLHTRYSQRVIELVEQVADGQAGFGDLQAASMEARNYAESDEGRLTEIGCSAAYAAASITEAYPGERTAWIASSTADCVRNTYYWIAYEAKAAEGSTDERARQAGDAAASSEEAVQITLLYDIIGNPFRPSVLEPAWITWNDQTVKRLAEAIYDQRELPTCVLDSARLNVLADALEEAGCDNAEILAHCRGPGPHVRGCWVVDLLLGKG